MRLIYDVSIDSERLARSEPPVPHRRRRQKVPDAVAGQVEEAEYQGLPHGTLRPKPDQRQAGRFLDYDWASLQASNQTTVRFAGGKLMCPGRLSAEGSRGPSPAPRIPRLEAHCQHLPPSSSSPCHLLLSSAPCHLLPPDPADPDTSSLGLLLVWWPPQAGEDLSPQF